MWYYTFVVALLIGGGLLLSGVVIPPHTNLYLIIPGGVILGLCFIYLVSSIAWTIGTDKETFG